MAEDAAVKRTYSPLAVANEFIVRSGSTGVSHQKLQKLVYLAHGWWLVVFDDPILKEAPQVWQFGPIFVSLYNVLKDYRSLSIRVPQTNQFNMEPPRVDNSDDDVMNLIDWVWRRYGHLTGIELSEMTHSKGSPWEKIAAAHNYRVPLMKLNIPSDVVMSYFRDRADEMRPARP